MRQKIRTNKICFWKLAQNLVSQRIINLQIISNWKLNQISICYNVSVLFTHFPTYFNNKTLELLWNCKKIIPFWQEKKTDSRKCWLCNKSKESYVKQSKACSCRNLLMKYTVISLYLIIIYNFKNIGTNQILNKILF